jgi:hypothetical protein
MSRSITMEPMGTFTVSDRMSSDMRRMVLKRG